MERWLCERDLPRLQMSLIVGLTGLASLLFSFLMLQAGLTQMWIRYPAAIGLAYLVFLLLLRLWIWLQKRRPINGDTVDAWDLLDIGSNRTGSGGSSINATDNGSWDWVSDALDFEDVVFLIVAAVAILAGVAVCLFVIWSSPALLAEILVDSVVMTGVYHRIKVTDRRYWLTGAIRRTWLAAFLVALFFGAAGYALQKLVPEAPSIGPVVHRLAERESK